jgi:hypothetical protein
MLHHHPRHRPEYLQGIVSHRQYKTERCTRIPHPSSLIVPNRPLFELAISPDFFLHKHDPMLNYPPTYSSDGHQALYQALA